MKACRAASSFRIRKGPRCDPLLSHAPSIHASLPTLVKLGATRPGAICTPPSRGDSDVRRSTLVVAVAPPHGSKILLARSAHAVCSVIEGGHELIAENVHRELLRGACKLLSRGPTPPSCSRGQ
jgi:hypothetical protein